MLITVLEDDTVATVWQSDQRQSPVTGGDPKGFDRDFLNDNCIERSLLETRHFEIGSIASLRFSADSSRAVAARDWSAVVWDTKRWSPLLELREHSSSVTTVAFGPRDCCVATGCEDGTVRIWHTTAGDGSERRENRWFWTRPRPDRHRESLDAATKAHDTFAAAFHLDRLLAYLPDERPSLLAERAKMPVNHLVAERQNRFAHRLQALAFMGRNQHGPAVPLLHVGMIQRRYNEPPVEELLIAEALLALNKPEDAKRYYRAAVEWLDATEQPMRLANVLTAAHPFAALANLPRPTNPRYNEFAWESWISSVGDASQKRAGPRFCEASPTGLIHCPSCRARQTLKRPSAAGSYAFSHWMISMRLPSGSRMKKRSQCGMSVVSAMAMPRSRKYSRAALASSTCSAKCLGLMESGSRFWSKCNVCPPPRSNQRATKSNVRGGAISARPSCSR